MDQPNVLLMHYTDVINDHEGAVRRLAKFMDVSLTDVRRSAY